MKLATALVLFGAASSLACGGSASARLKLHDATGTASAPSRPGALTAAAATMMGYRMIAVYVAEGVDPVTQDNTGQNSIVWLAPECQGSIEACNLAGEPGDGPRVSTYFDFAQGTTAVNLQLNSQNRDVEPGTYNYARVEFCKIAPGGAPAQANVEWQVSGMDAPHAFKQSMCGVTSKAFAAPMVVKAGDTIEVTLDYDLEQMIVSGAPDGNPSPLCFGAPGYQQCFMDCADVGGTRYCVNTPQFVPSARKIQGG
jgi:hypothetical protein